ncbi:amidohydrolase family protein [Paenibacillus sp. NPDC058071]|uniref:amidohydrolase family protein n=1 Tax=Paenibacillus sp. NPDC058071 TaxID=3346326 RepID=UPI0036DB1EF2
MTTLKLNRVRIGQSLYNLVLDQKAGVFADIKPADQAAGEKASDHDLDGQGLLYLPALHDHHIHLDKHFLGEPWKPLQPFVTLPGQLAFEKRMLSELPTTAGERARRMLDRLLDYGTTSIRTHIDVDPVIGLRHLEDVLAVREQYKGLMDIEIVAFPQQGLLRSDSRQVMKEALRAGADLVGGVDPAGLDRQLERSLEAMFELSVEFDAGVDLHLHDAAHLGLYTIDRFTDMTAEAGKQGRTAVSHAYGLGQVGEDELAELALRLREVGVAIITSVPIDRPMPPVDRLIAAEVKVGVGCDNILDAWSPFGSGDLLARGSRLAEKLGWTLSDQLLQIYPLISNGGFVPQVGDKADFMLVDAMNPEHAIAAAPLRQAVFAKGKLAGGQWLK